VSARENVSQRWECEDCGGDVELVDVVNSDAHATESYDCVECGESAEVQFFEGPDSPRKYGVVER